jgi:hypothetical protein
MQTFPLANFLDRQGISRTHEVYVLYNTLDQYTTESTWLAGGAVMSLIKGYKHNSDFDYFFGSQTDLEHFYNNLIEIGAVETFKTPNAITLTYGTAKIQLINKKFYSGAGSIVADFDLTISMFVLNGDNLYCGDYSLMDLANRELRVENVNALGYTIKRLFKYGKKGFHITPQAYTKVMEFFTVNPQLDLHITNTVNELSSRSIAGVAPRTTATPVFEQAVAQVGTVYSSNY